ncbi:MAG: isoleucine--tRNA ligase [Candidatus Paceibacterota bacterium]|jgi:isoleucyl-tRNA synthetase
MDFKEKEQKILDFWKKEDIFKKTLRATDGAPEFVFYDGPITVNAEPGIHHVEARVYKDIIARYKTMRGFHVARKNGWDTHGLPVELQVEKKLGFKSKKDIEKYGIAEFNKECRKTVDELIPVFRTMTERIGYWIDMDNPYITYSSDYIETLWWILKQIWDEGLLYEDFKIVPWCSRCGTGLSSHELAQGYENIRENSVYIKLKVRPNQKIEDLVFKKDAYILSWTTTPWTLPGNVALAVGKKMDYVLIEKDDKNFILAKSRPSVIEGPYKIIKEFKGKDIEGLEYEAIFDIKDLQTENSYKIYCADFVTEQDGTGVVHIASMYGNDDFDLGTKYNLPKIHTVNEEGKFNKLVTGFEEKQVKTKETEKDLVDYLKEKDILLKQELVSHDYPFCWRCKSPLIYYAKQSWFIKVTEIQQKLIRANEKINWLPEHLKEGRFGEWLNGVKDWAITRERYWGTPFPVWRCPSCNKTKCIGSFEELGQKIVDPHRPYIDDVNLVCECGGSMKREPYVLDVWFDSGSMPFGQAHFPFKQTFSSAKTMKDKQIKNSNHPELFPADYIAEAIDQTRGWFYTLLAVSVLLDQESPYKNVVCLGHVLDSKGNKMSKSKGNIVSPNEIIDKYGADAIRWYFFTINQPGDPKRFDEKDIKKSLFQLLLLENSFSFLNFYIDNKKKISINDLDNLKVAHILDQWLLIRLADTQKQTTLALDKFEIVKAARVVDELVGDLSYSYIHWSRTRLKKDSDKTSILVLVKTIYEITKLLAPFTPFTSEHIYQNLRNNVFSDKNLPESIHLEKWLETKEITEEDRKILEDVVLLKTLIGLGLRARKNSNIKVRQPLSEIRSNINFKNKTPFWESIVRDELNVKTIKLVNSIDNSPEWITEKDGSCWISLNTSITPELKEEGLSREVIRHTQILRKEAGKMPQDKIKTNYCTSSPGIVSAIKKHESYILSVTGSTEIFINEPDFASDHQSDILIDDQPVKIGIKKV